MRQYIQQQMASNQHTGLNPLNIPRVDASTSGINSAFAEVSREIAKGRFKESLGAGSLQTGNGTFAVPASPSEQVRPRHAFHAVVYMDALDSSTVKANFQAAYVIEQDDTQFPIFADEDDQTRTVLTGDKYWVKILVDDRFKVKSASFIEDDEPEDVAPTPSTDGEIYKLCVEFDDDDGKLVVIYHRFDSINYRSSSHPWKVTSNGDATVAVAAGELLSFNHESVSIPTAGVTNLSSYFNLEDFASYAGGNVAVGGAGYIYAKISFTTGSTYTADAFDAGDAEIQHWLDSVVPTGLITLHYAASLPTSDDAFHVKLAEVSVAEGVSSVDKQIVTHNPTLFMQKIIGFFG